MKYFNVNFDVEVFVTKTINVPLSEKDIWPDRDGPADPTSADVLKELRKCGTPKTVVKEWNLYDS